MVSESLEESEHVTDGDDKEEEFSDTASQQKDLSTESPQEAAGDSFGVNEQ